MQKVFLKHQFGILYIYIAQFITFVNSKNPVAGSRLLLFGFNLVVKF